MLNEYKAKEDQRWLKSLEEINIEMIKDTLEIVESCVAGYKEAPKKQVLERLDQVGCSDLYK